MHIVRNKDIDHHINNYLKIFNSEGAIAFELRASEYTELRKLVKWYKQKTKSQEPLNRESWVKELTEIGTSHDSGASFVFGFISLNWNKNTHISIEESGPCYS